MTADGGGDYDDNDKDDDGLDAIRALLMQVSPSSGIYTGWKRGGECGLGVRR